MGYTQDNYKAAIEFGLNYPPEIRAWYYDQHKDIFKVQVLDNGIYEIKLQGEFIRHCLKWKGIKEWKESKKKSSLNTKE
jgi:hypothetical protein